MTDPHVLLAGSWRATGADTAEALAAVAHGIRERRPDTQVSSVVLGRGKDFAAALDSLGEGGPRPVLVADGPTQEVGRALAAAAEQGTRVVLEGGHPSHPDAGLGMLGALTGAELPHDHRIAHALPEALVEARRRVAGLDLLMAASTNRPLLGMASVLAVDPDLSARQDQDRAFTSALLAGFAAAAPARHLLALAGQDQDTHRVPARAAGSGAGGGVGAVVLALGGRLAPTGEVLRDLLDLDAKVSGADLVVVLEPRLDSPLLAEATLDTVSAVAAAHALPCVAVATSSSLSRHECAQWGLHGVLLTHDEGDDLRGLREAGVRLAHTWLPE
ncbi:glycerate kinase [Schaalia sp. 19OD2882]|uniref:glycerate kinase n=1 Tax=Schaalia sp. 19OD2882 TaxID=2794089 RepID=UPI001C1EDFB7|nr:glycerate kinase [Schaalia sp. 19OD2882]QWW20428.1 glycerate kinase [Schaalia sp. 19OD2882]